VIVSTAAIVAVVVILGLSFDYTNGFHDAANAIATAVSTRALTPRIALGVAAVMNFLGAFLGQGVAKR
jgi:inorganic phosphate transporter, PiT family